MLGILHDSAVYHHHLFLGETWRYMFTLFCEILSILWICASDTDSKSYVNVYGNSKSQADITVIVQTQSQVLISSDYESDE